MTTKPEEQPPVEAEAGDSMDDTVHVGGPFLPSSEQLSDARYATSPGSMEPGTGTDGTERAGVLVGSCASEPAGGATAAITNTITNAYQLDERAGVSNSARDASDEHVPHYLLRSLGGKQRSAIAAPKYSNFAALPAQLLRRRHHRGLPPRMCRHRGTADVTVMGTLWCSTCIMGLGGHVATT
jgi:hypothetical protein